MQPEPLPLFTGQYVQRSKGVTGAQSADQPALISQNGELQDGQLTLPRLLREAGYFTAHFGKWHTRFETESLGFPEPDLPRGDADDPEFDQLNAPFLPHYFEPDQLYDLQLDPIQPSPDSAPALSQPASRGVSRRSL